MKTLYTLYSIEPVKGFLAASDNHQLPLSVCIYHYLNGCVVAGILTLYKRNGCGERSPQPLQPMVKRGQHALFLYVNAN